MVTLRSEMSYNTEEIKSKKILFMLTYAAWSYPQLRHTHKIV